MGFFEKAGRRVEQFRQEARDSAEEEAEYACRACGARLYTARDACPECESGEVAPIETDEESPASDRSSGNEQSR